MKRLSYRLSPSLCMVATLALASGLYAQSAAPAATPAGAAPSQAGQKAAATQAGPGGAADESSAYYHYMMAHEYEEMATTFGRTEYATRAIEEYKMALN